MPSLSFILTKHLKATPQKGPEYTIYTLFYISVPSSTMNFLIRKTGVDRRYLDQYLTHSRYSINVNQLLFVNAVFTVWNTNQ